MKPAAAFEDKIRSFFIPIVLGVISLSVFLFIAAPQFNQLKIDRQALSQVKKAANILQTKLSAVSSLDESSQAETLETALSGLPLGEPFREALLSLDRLPARYQVGIFQVKVESRADYLEIKFMALGPMSSIQKFVAQADRILPISAVVAVEASRIHDSVVASDSSSVYQADIAVRVFFKPPPKTIGRPSDPLPVLTADHLTTLELLSEFEQILPASADDSTVSFSPAPRLFPE